MSFFQNGQLVLTPHEQQDADLACDELDSIQSSKEDLFGVLVTLKARHPEIDFSDLIGTAEDCFDDALSKKWFRSIDVSGSIKHSQAVPSFAELAVKRGIKWGEQDAVNSLLHKRNTEGV